MKEIDYRMDHSSPERGDLGPIFCGIYSHLWHHHVAINYDQALSANILYVSLKLTNTNMILLSFWITKLYILQA